MIASVLLVLGLGAGIWYINSGQFTQVPPLLTQTEAQAKQRLAKAGLDVGDIKHRYSVTDQRGTVIATDPAVGARIRDHGKVNLTISLGPETVKVPELKGVPLAQARAKLRSVGLAPGMVTRDFDDDVPKGAVIETDPAAGTTRKADTAVALTLSRGRPVDVPDVTGESPEDARADLQDEGLTVKVAPGRVTSQVEAGQVAAQSPAAGSQAGEGDTVTLTISKGPEMVKVPDVVGESVDDAKRDLEKDGFQVDEDRGLLGLFGDRVKSQSVRGGERAPKGSTITIVIR